MDEGALRRAESAFAEARRHLEAGELGKAARKLERARRGYLALVDLPGMARLRGVVEEAQQRSGADDEALFEPLLYATAQNIRFLTRREAAERGLPWRDPHPELDDRRRLEMRPGRFIRRRDLPRIVLFATVGVVFVGALLSGYVYATRPASKGAIRTIVNDMDRPLLVATCKGGSISTDRSKQLVSGKWTIRTRDSWFVVSYPDGDRIGCLPVTQTPARASRAGPCPNGCYS